MINKTVKCPKCGKVLLKGYTIKINSIRCTCGNVVYSGNCYFRKEVK